MQFISVRLLVSDFPACFRFYRDVMGFKPTFGEENDVYAFFDTGATGIELFVRQLMAEAVGRADAPARANAQDGGMLSFKVDNVDETCQQLKGRGVAFVTEPTDRADWGVRAAHFRDPDGNLLEIYHSIQMTEDARTGGV
jgi:lactoylglutathione lyase